MAGNDPLLACLEIVSKLHHKHFSPKEAVAGLPLIDGVLTPSLFVRAAEQIGFSASMHEKSLKKINSMNYPVVLVLKDNNACVLNKKIKKGLFEIILPDGGGKTMEPNRKEDR